MTGGEPWSPYPSLDGMISLRLPPFFMPTMPSSQPWITSPFPSVKLKGWLRSQLESNLRPSRSQPVYCMVMCWPVAAWAPVPTVMSPYFSPSLVVVPRVTAWWKSSVRGWTLAQSPEALELVDDPAAGAPVSVVVAFWAVPPLSSTPHPLSRSRAEAPPRVSRRRAMAFTSAAW